MLLYYGLPSVGVQLDAFTVGVIALSMTSGAYVGEIVRAGIQSIDPGQMRAARSLGMSYAKAMQRIILPQAMRRVLPPITNEALTLDQKYRAGLHHRARRSPARRARSDDMAGQYIQPLRRRCSFLSRDHIAARLAQWLALSTIAGFAEMMSSPASLFDLLITDARLLQLDIEGGGLTPCDIAIRNGRLVRLAPAGSIPRHSAMDVIDADGGVVMPGLVNAHTFAGKYCTWPRDECASAGLAQ